MKLETAIMFDDLIVSNRIKTVLEIGTYKGAGTCYLANSLIKNSGHITTIDITGENNELAKNLAGGLGFINIEYIFSQYGSAWEICKLLKQNRRYDLVYIDGNHDFEFILNDFCLADKIVNLGGFVVFDDYNLCWDKSSIDYGKKWYIEYCKKQGKEKIESYQTQMVVDLVKTYHKVYDVKIIKNHAICRKNTLI